VLDRFVLRREPIASAPHFCRRSAAFSFILALILGLTPQAMNISPLRGSGSHDNFSSGLDTVHQPSRLSPEYVTSLMDFDGGRVQDAGCSQALSSLNAVSRGG